MKVVMVGNFGLHRKGTMGVRALPMARALTQRGHEVCLVIPPWDEPELSGRELVVDGVRVKGIPVPCRPGWLTHGVIAWRLLRAVLAERPAVVHTFKPKAYAGCVAFAVWWLAKLRLWPVRLVMDSDDWEGPGGWNEMEGFSPFQKWLVAWQERWGLRHNDAVTVASDALRTLVWSLGVPAEKAHYVPNGANGWGAGAGRDVRRELGLEARPVVLLYTRFFEFQLPRLLSLWERIQGRVPAAFLLVVGAGLRGEEHELRRLLGQDNPDVHFAGWVDSAGLPDYFRAADVAIYPMDDTLLNRAKCPMKLVDLLSAGVPVVAERVGQVPEYVQHGSSGVLVPSGDTEAFSQAVVALLSDPEERRRIGAQARTTTVERFAWDRLVGTVERAFGLSAS